MCVYITPQTVLTVIAKASTVWFKLSEVLPALLNITQACSWKPQTVFVSKIPTVSHIAQIIEFRQSTNSHLQVWDAFNVCRNLRRAGPWRVAPFHPVSRTGAERASGPAGASPSWGKKQLLLPLPHSMAPELGARQGEATSIGQESHHQPIGQQGAVWCQVPHLQLQVAANT